MPRLAERDRRNHSSRLNYTPRAFLRSCIKTRPFNDESEGTRGTSRLQSLAEHHPRP